jgi:predicted PurR-regulated permease PerM
MRETVGVSPLTVLLGILIGSALYRLPGAFLAVPVAAAVQVLLAHVLCAEDDSQAEKHANTNERLQQEGSNSHRSAREAADARAGA